MAYCFLDVREIFIVVLLVHFFLIALLMYCGCMCSGNVLVEVTLVQGMELYVVILRPGRILADHFCTIPVTFSVSVDGMRLPPPLSLSLSVCVCVCV